MDYTRSRRPQDCYFPKSNKLFFSRPNQPDCLFPRPAGRGQRAGLAWARPLSQGPAPSWPRLGSHPRLRLTRRANSSNSWEGWGPRVSPLLGIPAFRTTAPRHTDTHTFSPLPPRPPECPFLPHPLPSSPLPPPLLPPASIPPSTLLCTLSSAFCPQHVPLVHGRGQTGPGLCCLSVKTCSSPSGDRQAPAPVTVPCCSEVL